MQDSGGHGFDERGGFRSPLSIGFRTRRWRHRELSSPAHNRVMNAIRNNHTCEPGNPDGRNSVDGAITKRKSISARQNTVIDVGDQCIGGRHPRHRG